jgi:hypothetical protein
MMIERGRNSRDDTHRGPAEPITAVKLARLVEVDGRISFAPRYARELSNPYEADADAVCESEANHTAPAPRCRCGFHGVAARDELWRLDMSPEAVILEVELAGKVIEHEFGWRAGHQSVLGLHLPALCARWGCRRATVGVAPGRADAYELGMKPWTLLRPSCARCAKRKLVTIADLASALGVEVTVDSPPPRRFGRARAKPLTAAPAPATTPAPAPTADDPPS